MMRKNSTLRQLYQPWHLEILLVAAFLIAAPAAYSQDRDSFRSSDDIPNLIEENNEQKESRIDPAFPGDFLERWSGFKTRLAERTGLTFSLAHAYVLQGAYSDTRSVTGSGGQAELDFAWTLFGREGSGPKGLIGGKLESRHKIFSPNAPQQVAPKAGSIWTGALGYGVLDIALSQFWYEQHLVRDRVLLRVGKISPFTVFDYYKYKSPRVAFLGQPQNFNPTIAFPSSSLGIGGAARLKNGGYIAAGVFDANGVPTRPGFDTLFDQGELFTIADFGWAPDFVFGLEPGQDYRPGNDDYHLTLWHSDARKKIGRPEGWGFTASAQKGFDDIVPFARYGYSNGGATPLEHLVSVGAGFENILGYEDDVIGIALNWGDPSASTLEDQYGFEAFYRMQLTPNIAITPDLQLIANPATDPTSDYLGVFSIRGRLTL